MNDEENIILIVADTLTAKHLDLYGYERETAPFLKELAEENAYVEHGYSNAPWTVPSHASLFTGKLPKDHGTTSESMFFGSKAPLAQRMKLKGYRTQAYSANSLISKTLGFNTGFQEFISDRERIEFRSRGAKTLEESLDNNYDSKTKKILDIFKKSVIRRDLKSIKEGFKYFTSKYRAGGKQINYFKDSGAEAINNLIKNDFKDQKEPFFTFINYMEVHGPYIPPNAKWTDKEDKAKQKIIDMDMKELIHDGAAEHLKKDIHALYDSEIYYLDQKIKELYNFIEENFENNKYIIVGDHGENLGENGMWGHHREISEQLINVPIIIAGDNIENTEIDKPVSLREIYNYILGSAELDDLGSDKIFSEYHGAEGFILGYSNNDNISEYTEEELNLIKNESKAVITGKKGLIKNTQIEDTIFEVGVNSEQISEKQLKQYINEKWKNEREII